MAHLNLVGKTTAFGRTVAVAVVLPTTAFPLRVEAAHLFALLATLFGLTLMLLPATFGLIPTESKAAGTLAIFLGLWGTGLILDYAAAILFLFAANALAIAPAAVVFSGFTSQAGWFIFGGLLFGSAVQQSGLGQYIAEQILKRIGRSYLSVLGSITLIAVLLTFLLPSAVGRIVIIVPIVVLLAERLGFAPGSNGYAGMVLAAVLATTQPCYTVLTGSFPNIAIVGLGAQLYEVEVSYANYLVANFPVMGVLAAAAIPLVLRTLFPDCITSQVVTNNSTDLGKEGRNTLFVMIIVLVLWMTDFAHGVSPAWVALGAGAFCIMPGFGPIRDVPFSQCLNFNIWFLCCVLMGLGAIVDHVGLGTTVAEALVQFLGISPGNDFINFYLINGLNLVITALGTTAGAPAILSPLAGELAKATGWPVLTVLYAQIPALLFFPLPYAMPAVIAGVAMGALRFKHAIKALCVLSAVGFLLILPLQFLWWQVIGYLP
jgi:di/tricarboxylate transporter